MLQRDSGQDYFTLDISEKHEYYKINHEEMGKDDGDIENTIKMINKVAIKNDGAALNSDETEQVNVDDSGYLVPNKSGKKTEKEKAAVLKTDSKMDKTNDGIKKPEDKNVGNTKSINDIPQENVENAKPIADTPDHDKTDGIKKSIHKNVDNTKPINNIPQENVENAKPINDIAQENIENAKPINDIAQENIENAKPTNDIAQENIENAKPSNNIAQENIENPKPIKDIAQENIENAKPVNDTSDHDTVSNASSNASSFNIGRRSPPELDRLSGSSDDVFTDCPGCVKLNENQQQIQSCPECRKTRIELSLFDLHSPDRNDSAISSATSDELQSDDGQSPNTVLSSTFRKMDTNILHEKDLKNKATIRKIPSTKYYDEASISEMIKKYPAWTEKDKHMHEDSKFNEQFTEIDHTFKSNGHFCGSMDNGSLEPTPYCYSRCRLFSDPYFDLHSNIGKMEAWSIAETQMWINCCLWKQINQGNSWCFCCRSISKTWEKVHILWYLSLVVRKPVFGVSDQVRHKPGCTATEDG